MMSKLAMLTVLLLGASLTITPAVAAEPGRAGQVRLNPENLSRAAQVVARNKELFQDRQKLETLVRLSKNMQRNREIK